MSKKPASKCDFLNTDSVQLVHGYSFYSINITEHPLCDRLWAGLTERNVTILALKKLTGLWGCDRKNGQRRYTVGRPVPPRLRASQVAQVVKNPPVNAGDTRDKGSRSGSGRSPGGGNGNPLQYSCLGDPMDRGAWRATVPLTVTPCDPMDCSLPGSSVDGIFLREFCHCRCERNPNK